MELQEASPEPLRPLLDAPTATVRTTSRSSRGSPMARCLLPLLVQTTRTLDNEQQLRLLTVELLFPSPTLCTLWMQKG